MFRRSFSLRPVRAVLGPLVVLMLATAFVLLPGLISPGAAEQPKPVANAVLADGVYVSASRLKEVDLESLIAVVNEAKREGILMGIILPFDPIPDNKAFALRVRQESELDAILSIDREGAIHADTSEDLSGREVRALEAARSVIDGSPVDISVRFLEELATEPERTTPTLVSGMVRAVVYLVLALAALVVLEQGYRAFRRKRRSTNAPAA